MYVCVCAESADGICNTLTVSAATPPLLLLLLLRCTQALRNVASVLKPGSGRVLFRDYAEGDLAQTRLQVRT